MALFVKPSAEIEPVNGIQLLKNIEKAGRTCYKSENNISDSSAIAFISSILKRGHESVIEHEKVTARVICDRGVTHEIVRHRLASYSQESTRYCNYKGGVTFILPPWVDIPEGEFKYGMIPEQLDLDSESADWTWLKSCIESEVIYQNLLEDGWTPQMARSILPNSLKTEIVMTMNLREWRHFFKLRTAKASHPQMREVAIDLYLQMKSLIPIIFDDIYVEE